MSINISSIRETVTNTFSWAATSAVQFGRNVVQVGTKACSSICPALQTLVAKVKNVQPSMWCESVKTFFKSDTGRAFAGVGVGIASFTAAQKVQSSWARVALWSLGVGSVVYSAARVLKPGLTVFGVRI